MSAADGELVQSEAPALGEPDARQLAEQIREQFGRTAVKAAELFGEQQQLDALITAAYKGRAWIALGYPSWSAMCAEEFSQDRLRLKAEERQEHVQALIREGLSTRAVGAVLGIDKRTVSRDLAGGALAPPATARGPVQGLDGKPYVRPSQVETVDRVVKASELAAKGYTQAQIGAELGVSQRSASTYLRKAEDWKAKMPEDARERLETGRMSRSEVVDHAGLVLSDAPSTAFPRMLEAHLRGVSQSIELMEREVFQADEYVMEPSYEVAERAAAGLALAIEKLAYLLSDGVSYGFVGPQVAEGIAVSLEKTNRYLRNAAEEIEVSAHPTESMDG